MNRLKVILAEKGISNDDFAKLMKTTAKTVSAWVTNRRQPSLMKIYQWAKVLNVEAAVFLYPIAEIDNISIEEDDEKG